MNLIKKNNTFQISIHILIWIVLFSIPYFLSSGTFEDHLIEFSWIPIIFYAISFYINYGWLADKLFHKKERIIFICLNIALILIFLVLNFILRITIFKHDIPPHMHMPHRGPGGQPSMSLFMYKDIISYLIPVIFAVAIRATMRWSKAESLQKEAEKERLTSEIQHLKYQLQPHFFFNSLNNIYALVDTNPERAKENIHTLGKLMRYMLYESNTDKVLLSKEIDFMKRYIDLMAMRSSNKTSVSYQFPTLAQDVEIPPLLFISLIENAFKHGVSASKETKISFNLMLTNSNLYFVAENENLPKQSTDKSGSGIGLDNLEKRLKLLFPQKYTMTKKITDNIYWIGLSIDLTGNEHEPQTTKA